MDVSSIFFGDIDFTNIYYFVIQLLHIQITELLDPLLIAHLFIIKYYLFVFNNQNVIFMTSYNLADYPIGFQNLHNIEIIFLFGIAEILDLDLLLFLFLNVLSKELFRSLAIRLNQLSESIVCIPFFLFFIFLQFMDNLVLISRKIEQVIIFLSNLRVLFITPN